MQFDNKPTNESPMCCIFPSVRLSLSRPMPATEPFAIHCLWQWKDRLAERQIPSRDAIVGRGAKTIPAIF
jgi:hypothetical protein